MKNITSFFFIIIALAAGLIAGDRYDIFNKKTDPPPYTYSIQLPDAPAGKGTAFSGIVKVISPLVVNISSSKIVDKKELNPFSHFFESPFSDNPDSQRPPRQWKEESLGSGVLVSPDGFIITNNHVVEKADKIKVTMYNKETYIGKIIGTDPKTDLAVIKISAENLPAINWGDSDTLQVGEFVLAFGNPYSLGHTVTMGIVSAVGRANVGIADYEDFIQTDAAINPGNSGGPLVSAKGELIGINTAIFSRTGGYQGIGFAVPSNMAHAVMTQLIKQGKVTRGWLGITIQNLTPELADEFHLLSPSGAIVTDIFKNSPAEKSGMQRGDIIIEVNDKTIENVETLRNVVAQSTVDSEMILKVIRNGKTVELTTRVSEFPSDIARTMPDSHEEPALKEENSLAGFSVMNLTREIAKQLGLSRNESGVVVVNIENGSPAENAGLKKGDVIQEINKKRVSDLTTFNKLTKNTREGDTLLLFINRSGNKFYITFKIYS
ncbi:MAG: DegQ family serine endoprotease [Nitrospira sp.]|nr:DegQ family serine endoprotease [bacterium]MBL7048713.1 DegQ family serine endoprotease [Nitrospira sp.]